MSEPQPPQSPPFPWVGSAIATFLLTLIFNVLTIAVAFITLWGSPPGSVSRFIGTCGWILLTPYWTLRWLIGLIPGATHNCEIIGFGLTVTIETVAILIGLNYLHQYMHKQETTS